MKVRIVLVGIEGAVNLGVIARTCKNFGADELYLVNPKTDLQEAMRYAAKARDYLASATIVNSLEEALHNVELVVATSAKGYSFGDILRQSLSLVEFTDIVRKGVESIALLFGRESTGLTRSEISYADILVTIPANPEYPVLNVSQAVALFLWEIWKVREIKVENIPPRATREDLEELLLLIRELSEKAVGVKDKVNRIMVAWKRVLFKSRMSKYEYRLIKYWTRRILNKLRRPSTADI
ncbi:MAG: RNA methyltransferase [Thermoprotei archaeon]|nr:MAG: RNA methyltransferase [Thermoprotei archaeon]